MTDKVNQRPYCDLGFRERKFNKLELEIANWFEQLLRKYSDKELSASMMISDTCGIYMTYTGFDEYNEKHGIIDPRDDDASIIICCDLEFHNGLWFIVKRHHDDVFSMQTDCSLNDREYIETLKRVLYFKPLIEKFFEMEAKRQMETGDKWVE